MTTTPAHIRTLAELARRAAQLAASQPTTSAQTFAAEHARINQKLTSAALR